ncbi:MAG: hypothetical protein Q9209_002379 [Squamulea sp. 1 TL-2023]
MALEPTFSTVGSSLQLSRRQGVVLTQEVSFLQYHNNVIQTFTETVINAQEDTVLSTTSGRQIVKASTIPTFVTRSSVSQASVARTEDLIPEKRESTASPSTFNTTNVTSVPAPSGQQSVRNELSVASKAGVGVGVVLVAIVLCVVCYFLRRRSRKRRQIQHNDNKFINHPEQTTINPQVITGKEDAKPVELPSSFPNRPEIDGNPLHEAPNLPKSLAELPAKSIAKGRSPWQSPINRLRSYRGKEHLSKLEQKERQLQEEIARLEELGRLKTEREEVRQKINELSQHPKQDSRPLSV